jgi:hypothetical protein
LRVAQVAGTLLGPDPRIDIGEDAVAVCLETFGHIPDGMTETVADPHVGGVRLLLIDALTHLRFQHHCLVVLAEIDDWTVASAAEEVIALGHASKRKSN